MKTASGIIAMFIAFSGFYPLLGDIVVFSYDAAFSRTVSADSVNTSPAQQVRENGYLLLEYSGMDYLDSAMLRLDNEEKSFSSVNSPINHSFFIPTRKELVFHGVSGYFHESYSSAFMSGKKASLSRLFNTAVPPGNLPRTMKGVFSRARNRPTGSLEILASGILKCKIAPAMTDEISAHSAAGLQDALAYLSEKYEALGYADISPSAADDVATLSPEDLAEGQILINVLDNDGDPNSLGIQVNRIVRQPSHGKVFAENNGTLQYRFETLDGFAGDSFSYEIISEDGGVDSASVSIAAVPPVLMDDIAYNTKDKEIWIDVLANDSDPFGGMLQISSVYGPMHGSASAGSGKIIYSPDIGFTGMDVFNYTARNSMGSEDVGTVTVWTDMPEPEDDKIYLLGDTQKTFDVLENDNDPCGLPLSVSGWISPAHGDLQFNEGKFTYAPFKDFTGMDSFVYSAGNGHGAEAEADVEIYIGGDPVANDDEAYTHVDTQILMPVLANDHDSPGADPYLKSVSALQSGTAVISRYSILFTPENDFTGKTSFDYSISNVFGGISTAKATVLVNDFQALDDFVFTSENKEVRIDVLANDTDACGLEISIAGFSKPNFGSLALEEDGFLYAPPENFIGQARFDYSISNGYESKSAEVIVYVDSRPVPAKWVVDGDAPGDNFGYSAGTAGDVNGDGYDDLIVAAPHWDGTGYCRVFIGSEAGLSKSHAWEYHCEQSGAYPGFVASAGDVNGDRYGDIIIGIPLFNASAQGGDEGRVLVFHGGKDGLPAIPDWSYTGSQEGARLGRAVSSAGDVDGDGYDDIVVGAPLFSGSQANGGKVFLFRGGASGLEDNPSWTKELAAKEAQFGFSLSHGDINGDGYADMIAGAKGYTGGKSFQGAAFVFLGSASGLQDSHSWMGQGDLPGAEYGYSVSSADLNGDGLCDVVAGAWLYGRTSSGQGAAYIYYSTSGGLPAEPDRKLEGLPGSFFGFSANFAGDVDKDGFADLIVGAPAYSNFTGYVKTYHGSADGITSSPEWSEDGEGYGDFGFSAKFAGDLNNDGYADVVIGAPFFKNAAGETGRVYVFYGKFDPL